MTFWPTKHVQALWFAGLMTGLLVIGTAKAEEYKRIFNGKDLTGWSGTKSIWSVEDGAITGVTLADAPLKQNQFLVWDGKVADFEFKAEFRLTGNNNSGVQYRSARFGEPSEFRVRGYQADIHAKPAYTGMLYDEGGRGVVAQRGQNVVVDGESKIQVVGKTGEAVQEDLSKWTAIEIKAVGNRLVHKINGKITVIITDNDKKNRDDEGIIALQVHAGSPMKIQFRNVMIKHIAKSK